MKTRNCALATSLAMALVGTVLHAQTIVWVNTSSGDWNTAANWSPATVPGATDTAIIDQPGVTVTLTSATTVDSIVLGTNAGSASTLSINNQTLSLNGSLTVNSSGSFTIDNGEVFGNTSDAELIGTIGWTSGDLGGTLTLAAGSTLNIAGGAGDVDLPNTTLTNNGTVTWVSGNLRGGGGTGTFIYNNGLWDCQSDQQLQDAFGGTGTVFNNSGTFRKSGGAGEFVSVTLIAGGVLFNQLAGVIDVQNGVGTNGLQLDFQGGANLNGGYITTNQYGLTVLSEGSFNINGTVTGTNTWEDAGNLVGANVIKGALNWIGGNWDGASSVTIPLNSTLYVAGAAGDNDMQNCQVTNNGTVVWESGTIRGGGDPSGTTIYNNGLWDCQSDQQLQDAFGGVGTVFNNTGTFRKSGGAGEFVSVTLIAGGVLFNQLAGVIDVQNGVGTNGLQLDFQGGANLTGGYVTTNQYGLVVLSVGSFNINGTIISTNTWEDSGNLVGKNVIIGALTWIGGNWDGASSVTIAANSTLYVAAAGGVNDMQNCQVTNNGTVLWESGTIRGGGDPSGTTIYNNGLWDCQSDEQLQDAFGGVGTVFNNTGTFRKSGGAGEFVSDTLIAGGVLFNQLAGVIDVQNGVGTNGLQLDFQGGANLTGGYVTTNQYGLTVLSEGSFNINGTIISTNTWEDSGNLVGTNVIIGALTWIAGNWDSAIVTIAPNSTVTVLGAAGVNDISDAIVTNYGTVAWVSGIIRGGGDPGTFIYNHGLWDCQSDQVFQDAFGGVGTVFNNTGTLRKSGGASETTNATVFSGITINQLAGVIDVQNGTNGLQLAFQGGGNFTGGYITTNQFGLTTLEAANYTINGTVTGSNTWEADSGTLVGNNVIRGGLTWISGTWDNAAVTIAPATTVTMAGAAGVLDMSDAIVTNNGTVAWVSGIIRGGSDPGTFVYNYGLWNAQSDQTFSAAFGGVGIVFSNFGTFSKTGTSGGSTLFQGSAAFINPGTLDTEVGNITVQGGFTADHGTMHFGLTGLTNYGTLSLSTTLGINGTLGVGYRGGFAPVLGDSFTLITSTGDSSQFQNLNLPGLPSGDAWQVNYDPDTVVLQVVALGASDSEITGSVKDAPTHGVPDVSVFAFTTNNPNVYLSTTTDANGNYTLNVTNGNWTVGLSNITALGYNPVPDQTTTTSGGQPDQVVNFYVQVTGATAPAATTTAASILTSSGATLNGTVNPDGEAVSVFFEYGTTSLNKFTVTNTVSTDLTTTQPLAIPLTGLSPLTQYQFEIVAENSISTNFGGVVTFTTAGVAPTVVTTPATDIGPTNATVNGTVNPGGLATIYYFEFGTNISYGSFTPTNSLLAGTTTQVVTNLITNLQPGTVYHFQLFASNSVGTNIGGDLTFTNLSAPPTVLTLAASAPSASGGTLNGSVNPNGLPTLWYFEYGTSTNYGTVTPGSSLPPTNIVLAVDSVLTTLNSSTLYHFQLVASNSLGTNLGGDLTFTTSGSGISSPSALTLAATGLTSSGAALNATVNPNGEAVSVYFEYGTTSLNRFTVTNLVTTGLNTSQPITIPLTGLSPATQYQFQFVAQDGAGTSFGGVLSFTTLGISPAVVTLPATNIDSTNATVNGSINPGGVATSYYFEFGTDTSYGDFTPTNSLLAGNDIVVVTNLLTNLQPGTVYHFQLVGANSIGTNLGGDLTFTNLAAPPTVRTLAATAESATGATLNGSVNPNGLPTLWYFEYGTSTNYGTLTAGSSLPPTNIVLAVDDILTTLNVDTLYHFQLVASNGLGTNLGGDLTFSTGTVQLTITCPQDITTNQATGECSQLVAFAPIATGSPAPTVTSMWNGITITSPFSFPVGTNLVTCTASNVAGSQSCEFTVVVVDTNPPVAGPNSMGTYEGQSASVAVPKVLLSDSAPSGGTLSIPSVTPTTPNGAAVSLAAGLITYAPAASFVGVDYITYSLSDGCGIVPGTITVTVLSSNLPAKNELSISQAPTGTTVVFAGVPGANYLVQFAPAVSGPWTTFLGGPIQAAANGLMQYTDTTAPPPATRFYRTQYVSGP
jgi:hypothetical protein